MADMLRRGRERGQTIVEFALILPIFVLLLVGLFDFGRAIYAYNTISNAAREAARVAIVHQDATAIRTEAIGQSVSLHLTNGDVVITYANPDLSSGAPCNDPLNPTSHPNGCIVSVTVRYAYNAATPIIGNLVGTLNLSSTARMPIERRNP